MFLPLNPSQYCSYTCFFTTFLVCHLEAGRSRASRCSEHRYRISVSGGPTTQRIPYHRIPGGLHKLNSNAQITFVYVCSGCSARAPTCAVDQVFIALCKTIWYKHFTIKVYFVNDGIVHLTCIENRQLSEWGGQKSVGSWL